jgi:hypothetical protein
MVPDPSVVNVAGFIGNANVSGSPGVNDTIVELFDDEDAVPPLSGTRLLTVPSIDALLVASTFNVASFTVNGDVINEVRLPGTVTDNVVDTEIDVTSLTENGALSVTVADSVCVPPTVLHVNANVSDGGNAHAPGTEANPTARPPSTTHDTTNTRNERTDPPPSRTRNPLPRRTHNTDAANERRDACIRQLHRSIERASARTNSR